MNAVSTATPALAPPPAIGSLLRQWRERRRLSQLELASQTEISTRHLSFVETGRSRPSSELILRLTDELDVPLRERNLLLLAGGYAPVYPEHGLNSPQLAAVLGALRQVLDAHDPYPAVVIDRHWDLVDSNAAAGLFTALVPARLLAEPNVLRMSLHPDGLAPHIVNLGAWRAHLLSRLHRQQAATGDPRLAELLAELTGYPCDQPEPDVELPGAGSVAVPLQLRHGGRILSFLSVTAIFGTPLDVTVAELAVESFFPADAATADALRRR